MDRDKTVPSHQDHYYNTSYCPSSSYIVIQPSYFNPYRTMTTGFNIQHLLRTHEKSLLCSQWRPGSANSTTSRSTLAQNSLFEAQDAQSVNNYLALIPPYEEPRPRTYKNLQSSADKYLPFEVVIHA
jgi:hypothetical protein